MKRTLKLMIILLCAVAVVIGGVSCKASKPSEATLREDFESFLSYYGALPFKYDFKEFSIASEKLQNKYSSCDTTVTARVETYYGSELFSDVTYTLTLSYKQNSDGTWMLQFVTVQESETHKGFDAEKIFLENKWDYSEADSITASDDLQDKKVPLSFSFNQKWEVDAFSVTIALYTSTGKVESENRVSTYWAVGEYTERYSARVDWDFRLIYKMATGDVLDLVHLKGCDIYSPSSWVIGYRTSTSDTYNSAIYQLDK